MSAAPTLQRAPHHNTQPARSIFTHWWRRRLADGYLLIAGLLALHALATLLFLYLMVRWVGPPSVVDLGFLALAVTISWLVPPTGVGGSDGGDRERRRPPQNPARQCGARTARLRPLAPDPPLTRCAGPNVDPVPPIDEESRRIW